MANESAAYKKITDKGKEFKPMFDRMDIDRDLYFMKAYEMLRPDKKPMGDVINVTLNDAVTFAMRAIATLGTTARQTEVKGRDKKEKEYTLKENFIDDMSFAVDDRLVNRGIMTLDAFLNEQVCVRGPIVGRATLREKDGKLVPDVVPLDSRFFVHNSGPNGMKWGAAISYRSKQDIVDEYGEVPGINKGILQTLDAEKDNEVADLWDGTQNIVMLNSQDFLTQKNPYGYPPFIVTGPAIGSMLADKQAAKHRWESIFWANRELFTELHRTASIFQTINVGSFAGAMQYASMAGTRAKKPQKPPWGIYSVTPVDAGAGMGYRPIPMNDIKNAARLFYAILYTRIQQGGLSAIDYGNLTFPLSAVAITQLSSSRDQIFLPRIQAKAIFYQQLFKMIIKQYQMVGIKTKLGPEGWGREYTPSDLDGDYQIQFRFFTESREQEIANFSVANAATGFLSGATIRRTILKVQDPEAEEERMAAEQAEKMDEAIFLYNRCSKLIAQDRDIEAKIMARRLLNVLRARQGLSQPQSQQPAKETKAGGRQQIPLLGQGNARARSPQEVGTEEEEVAESAREEERIAAGGAEAKQERI